MLKPSLRYPITSLRLGDIPLYYAPMVAPVRIRVVVGMSGGVDSSATAALLLEQGYDVVGITLKLWPQDCVSRAEDKCCGPQAVTDARAGCHKLGIPYYLLDEAEQFQTKVIQYFSDEYKEESMEICFVPDNDYGKFLQQAKLVQKHRGDIVNLHGQVLGQHDGIEFYTIGQRKGLGISSPKPLYVVELDSETNRVVVGDESALERDEFMVDRCNWIPFDGPPETLEVTVKIRYNHPGTQATVTPL